MSGPYTSRRAQVFSKAIVETRGWGRCRVAVARRSPWRCTRALAHVQVASLHRSKTRKDLQSRSRFSPGAGCVKISGR